ncbi:cysteine synthase family protein [Candidatus Gribaldobacteria bacterium]|nr:cysteine synthase family protein [Candidatus Gribaldobacteria bacterium]
MTKTNNILSAIGNTPMVEIINLNSKYPHMRIFGKLEGSNPGGSIKDRPVLYMIEEAEKTGKLTKEKTIIEPTSGNTGIALAMVGAAKGYKVKLFMSESVSIERKKIIEAFGAEVILTPAKEGTDGAIRQAHELADKNYEKYFMPNQFDNENNVLSHYETTGPEIFTQTKGNIDYFVAGLGTSGTLMGTGKYLKEKNPNIKVIGVEPVIGHKTQGLKNMQDAIMPKIYNSGALDEKITVEDEDAFQTTRMLAKKEGILVGMSSGAAMAAALQLAKRINSGTIVIIFPDRGDRYLSTSLFNQSSL